MEMCRSYIHQQTNGMIMFTDAHLQKIVTNPKGNRIYRGFLFYFNHKNQQQMKSLKSNY